MTKELFIGFDPAVGDASAWYAEISRDEDGKIIIERILWNASDETKKETRQAGEGLK